MGNKPRNSCIEAVAGNRLLMKPWPLPGWRGNLLLAGCKGDVTMRDFRAIVDYLQCYSQNRGLVNPSRYLGDTLVGVLTVPASQISNPAVEPEAQEIHLTQVMKFHKKEIPMKFLDGLLPLYVLGLGEDTSYIRTLSSEAINLNTGSPLLMVDTSMEHLGKVSLPIKPLSCGAIIYLRSDSKPLLKHHYEALSTFVHREVRLESKVCLYQRWQRLGVTRRRSRISKSSLRRTNSASFGLATARARDSRRHPARLTCDAWLSGGP